MRSNPASLNRNCPTLPEIAGSPIGAVTPGVVRKKLSVIKKVKTAIAPPIADNIPHKLCPFSY